jgi:mannose-6-phosphate isomerase
VVRLAPLLVPKVWGGDALRRFGVGVAPGERIGEAWLVADLSATSTSGAGGAAMQSPIIGADGMTLRSLVSAAPDRWAPGAAAFPLLVKLLDAREHLSVQVHPSPAYAGSHPAVAVKHECWYILDAAPGAVLFLGAREGVTREMLAEAVRLGTVVDLLHVIPAVPGECHLLPSGLVHALGAGVTVAEVQTPSDTTFRLYDWTTEYGRAPRALHVGEGLSAAEMDLRPETRRPLDAEDALAAVAEQFTVRVRRLHAGDGWTAIEAGSGRPRVLLVLRGAVTARLSDEELRLVPGSAVALATDAGLVQVAATEDTELLSVIG